MSIYDKLNSFTQNSSRKLMSDRSRLSHIELAHYNDNEKSILEEHNESKDIDRSVQSNNNLH